MNDSWGPILDVDQIWEAKQEVIEKRVVEIVDDLFNERLDICDVENLPVDNDVLSREIERSEENRSILI